MMSSLPEQFHALVLGASGAIGAAFVDLLGAMPRCASVCGLHRHSTQIGRVLTQQGGRA